MAKTLEKTSRLDEAQTPVRRKDESGMNKFQEWLSTLPEVAVQFIVLGIITLPILVILVIIKILGS